jgi:hypothetical protein
MGFNKLPRIFLRDDPQNAQNPLGKTAYYDPAQMSVTLYISGRHPKDVMRSLSHELIHHTQNCNGQFDGASEMGEGYAQNDEHLREMEREAYEQGNLVFRDWEDSIKGTIYNESLQKGAKKKMSLKDWKNNELRTVLSEKWGFSFNLLNERKEEEELDEAKHEDEDLDEARGMAMPMGTKTLQPEGEMIVFSDGRFNVDVAGFGAVSGRIDEGDLEALMDPMAEGAASSGRAATPDRAQGGDRREDDGRKRPMEEGEKMPMKTDTKDADEDGDKSDKVPAFLDKGETKKKKSKGKQPPQLAAAQGKKKEKMDEQQIRRIIRKLVKEAMAKKAK